MTNAKLETLEVNCFWDELRPAFKRTRRLRVITSGINAGKFCVYSKGFCILVQEILGADKVMLDRQTPRMPRNQTRDALLRDIGLPLPRPLSLPVNPESQKSNEKVVKDERHEAWLLDNEVEWLQAKLELYRELATLATTAGQRAFVEETIEEALEAVRMARVATALRSVVELSPSTSTMPGWLKLLMHLTILKDS